MHHLSGGGAPFRRRLCTMRRGQGALSSRRTQDGENYIKGGTIGSFKPASGGTKDSVTLSLNLPGMMTVKNSVFEKVG